MDMSGGVFGRIGAAITQDTGDYERLDRHYQASSTVTSAIAENSVLRNRIGVSRFRFDVWCSAEVRMLFAACVWCRSTSLMQND